ncbi:MAG: ABC transporter permease [Firmicutes bacterium]|nr:ABC transporter permease [Bacillota bacterium]
MNKSRWGLGIIITISTLIILGCFYTPYDPAEIRVSERLQAPSKVHWAGTDHFGRDILSRIFVGGRISLLVGVAAVALGSSVGTLLGLWSGFKGGIWDEILMRFTDGFYALPFILLALLLATVWGPGVPVVLWAIAAGNIPIFLRLSRTQALKIKAELYVEAARALGASNLRLLWAHILPNIRSTLLVQFSASLAGAILVEASLSYLGVGIQPPQPSWGRMLREAQSYASLAPWAVWAPGLFMALTIIGFNLVGDDLIDKR